MNLKCLTEALTSCNSRTTPGPSIVLRTLLLRCLGTSTTLPNDATARRTRIPIEAAFQLWKDITEGRGYERWGGESRTVVELGRRLEGLMADGKNIADPEEKARKLNVKLNN